MTLTKLTLTVPETAVDAVTAWLFLNVPHGWQEEKDRQGRTFFSLYCSQSLVGEQLYRDCAARWPDFPLACVSVQDKDWTAAWREFFTPVIAGDSFCILPPWQKEYQQKKGHSSFLPLIIHPEMAFGTGHHASTILCLEALADLLRSDKNNKTKRFLDLGTGSGILGIACSLKGLSGIGLDIDPAAVDNAKKNIMTNRVDKQMTVIQGSLTCLDSTQQFDLIVANILAEPLVSMAGSLCSFLAPGGSLVLSGLLAEQADRVCTAYRLAGLWEPVRMHHQTPCHETQQESSCWTALVWQGNTAG